MLSAEFAASLIRVIEKLAQWSPSSNRVNITQVHLEEHWQFILRDIVQPVQQKIFTGYFSDVSFCLTSGIRTLSLSLTRIATKSGSECGSTALAWR